MVAPKESAKAKMFEVKQSNSVWAKVDGSNLLHFDLNNFLEFFLPQQPLEEYLTQIYGITTLNFAKKTFTITFNENDANAKKKFLEQFANKRSINCKNGKTYTLSARLPPPPVEVITLYPMPHGITTETAKKISSTWGNLISFEYGRHKILPHIRNSYLHLKIADVESKNIPQRIVVNKHYVAVLQPGDNVIMRCGFCKTKGHKAVTCPEKQNTNPSETRTPIRTTNRWNIHQNATLFSASIVDKNFPELAESNPFEHVNFGLSNNPLVTAKKLPLTTTSNQQTKNAVGHSSDNKTTANSKSPHNATSQEYNIAGPKSTL